MGKTTKIRIIAKDYDLPAQKWFNIVVILTGNKMTVKREFHEQAKNPMPKYCFCNFHYLKQYKCKT